MIRRSGEEGGEEERGQDERQKARTNRSSCIFCVVEGQIGEELHVKRGRWSLTVDTLIFDAVLLLYHYLIM